MSLFNVNWHRYSSEQLIHKKKYSPIIVKRDSTQNALINNRLQKDISEEERKTLESLIANHKNSRKELRQYTKRKNQLAKEQSFLGRSNFKFWLDQFGTETKALFLSLLLIFITIKFKLPKYIIWISILALSVTLFQLYHLFFKTASDFYKSTYIYVHLLLSVVAAVIIVVISKYLIKRDNLKTIIRSLFSFIFEEAEENNYYDESKKDTIRKRRVELVQKAIENEK